VENCFQAVTRWIHTYKNGRGSIEDARKSDRKHLAVKFNKKFINLSLSLTQISVYQIAHIVEIPKGSIYTIVKEDYWMLNESPPDWLPHLHVLLTSKRNV
jgi:hypothetical protein